MQLKPKYIIILLLASYPLILYITGTLYYILVPVYWILLTFLLIKLYGFKKIDFLSIRRGVVLVGLLTAALYLVSVVDAGLITKFGKSPYSHTPIGLLINLIYVSSMLIGMEFSRACLLVKTRKPSQAIISVSLLYTFIQMPIARLLFLTGSTCVEMVDFLGSQVLTSLASNLLASTLALLAGPVASLAYRAPIEAFWWFSPILPDLTWGWKTLTGIIPPIVGFIALIHQATLMELRKLGIRLQRAGELRAVRKERKEALWTVTLCIAMVLVIWFSMGLLNVFPSVVISGSMRPTIEVGDLIILMKTSAEKIKPGDIIQYITTEGMVVHRVIGIRDGLFITKGDAVDTPDPDPVHPLNVRGKVIAIIPKLGWASIYLKMALLTLYNVIAENSTFTYIVLVSAIPAVILATLKKHRRKRWRFRRW